MKAKTQPVTAPLAKKEQRDTLRPSWVVDDPSTSERAVLDLAEHLSIAAGRDVVSWHHQALASRYVRRYGFAAAVGRIL